MYPTSDGRAPDVSTDTAMTSKPSQLPLPGPSSESSNVSTDAWTAPGGLVSWVWASGSKANGWFWIGLHAFAASAAIVTSSAAAADIEQRSKVMVQHISDRARVPPPSSGTFAS